MKTQKEGSRKQRARNDFMVWLLLVTFSVLLFFVRPLVDGLGHLNRSGLKLIIVGVPRLDIPSSGTQLLLGELHGGVFSVNQGFAADYVGVSIEMDKFHAIVTQVHVIHSIPIEICDEQQVSLASRLSGWSQYPVSLAERGF
jgi:hypothetical protein